MNRGLGTSLRALVSQLDGGVQQIYDELNVNFRPRFYPIIHALLDEPSLSVGDIARRTGVSQPAATQTLNEMRRLGLVQVGPGLDRRARFVQLTASGREMVDLLGPIWSATQRAAEALDDQLSVPLAAILVEAEIALEERSFADRVRDQLKGQE
jgi:DNA-binding MarR family transcriptional regulator